MNQRQAKYWQGLTIAAASNPSMLQKFGSARSLSDAVVEFADTTVAKYEAMFCSKPTIPAAIVLKMIGGKWPEANGFAWSCVEHFEVNDDGTISPADGYDLLPGPDLKLRVTELLGL